LLGFWNPIVDHGSYEQTEVVKFILEANNNPNQTFVLLLDEMNLSYTERYFADFLSALESRTKEIRLPDDSKIYWSKNLKIIGTINEDETTHTLSPKVIDRSNIIEMDGVVPSQYFKELHNKSDKKASALYAKKWHEEYLQILDEVYHACEEGFGYRVVDEFTEYVKTNVDLTGEEFIQYFDEQLYQKVLPKVHGTRGEVGNILAKLQEICERKNLQNSLVKINKMISQLSATGFTSFVTA
jgi:hypothetical protein